MRRVVLGTLIVAAPALGALAALVVWARLDPLAAFLAALGVLGVTGLMVGRHLRDLARQVGAVLNLTQQPGREPPPRPLLPGAREISGAIAEARQVLAARTAAAEALIAANRAILERLPDALVLVDARRRVTRANAAARELLGNEVEGRELALLVRDPALLAAVETVLGGGTAQAVGLSLAGPVGRDFRVHLARLPPEAEGAGALIIAFHDVTAIQRAERMRADFVANVSHELKTPLATLMGFVETLRGAARDDAAARERFLVIMQEQAERMSRLVGDLLSLSRIEAAEHTPPTGTANLSLIIGGVADALMPQARARRMAIVADFPPDLPLVVGDGDDLAQVFQNLLDNALKYGRQGTKVRVGAKLGARPLASGGRLPAQLVAVTVSDEGDGIPREHLPRLTERFYRVEVGRSRQLGGTGLGLAIVKHIVNRHRGAFSVDSEVGKGTTCTVYLPAAPAAPVKAPAPRV